MKRIFYYTHKLLAPLLFVLSITFIITSFIADAPFNKLSLVLAFLTLLWLGKNQMELSLHLISRKIINSKNKQVSHKAFGNDIDWGFNSDDYVSTSNNFSYKTDLSSKNQVLKQDINNKKHINNHPEQLIKQHGIEVARLESNDSYNIANKAIFPN